MFYILYFHKFVGSQLALPSFYVNLSFSIFHHFIISVGPSRHKEIPHACTDNEAETGSEHALGWWGIGRVELGAISIELLKHVFCCRNFMGSFNWVGSAEMHS